MKTLLTLTIASFAFITAPAQSYEDSVRAYIQNYVSGHEVVKGEDRSHLHFFEPDKRYRVVARFEKKENTPWIAFPTSSKMKQNYRVYGVLHFTVNDTTVQLNLYQAQSLLPDPQFKNYLFLPFTDATTGILTYEAGRYIDLKTGDIQNGTVIIDFNKAYNPYCAYVSGLYSCPLPPAENRLPVAIFAGEMNYSKPQ